ncbi:MAG: hypothetical protein K9I94_08085 [Bacteroidales bacterium]|nr:hypothetical protein [Bacteroidales bacterium]
MATYTISIDENSEKAKTFLKFLEDYARDHGFVEIEKVPNRTTLEAMLEIEQGKTFKAKDVDDLFNQLEE